MNKRTEQQTVIADEQIIELYWQRNENAIQETDKKYGQFLFKIAYNILHDRLDCEECQNDTYNNPLISVNDIISVFGKDALSSFTEKWTTGAYAAK